VATHTPDRGEVWDVQFPSFGTQPAVVLSVNPLNARLRHACVIPITSSPGPENSHVLLTGAAELTGHDVAYADVTGLQPAEISHFRRLRGPLATDDLAQLADRLRVYLDL
jgi:mRNA-degrading endonuclease toxin of MazEF toxin-antitoxin module